MAPGLHFWVGQIIMGASCHWPAPWAYPLEHQLKKVMSTPTYFLQECPTCGRSLRISVQHLGAQVACKHCSARFQACDLDSGLSPPEDSGIGLLRRADELLHAVEKRRSEVKDAADTERT